MKDCDRIILLEKGSVTEQRTYDELMALDGGFVRLVKKQIED